MVEAKLQVIQDSIGFFIGYIKGAIIVKRSLYYDRKDSAQAELDDGSWIDRVNLKDTDHAQDD